MTTNNEKIASYNNILIPDWSEFPLMVITPKSTQYRLEKDSVLIAYAIVRKKIHFNLTDNLTDSSDFLDYFEVHPEYRKQGYGYMLCYFLVEIYKDLVLISACDVVEFWTKCGAVSIGKDDQLFMTFSKDPQSVLRKLTGNETEFPDTYYH